MPKLALSTSIWIIAAVIFVTAAQPVWAKSTVHTNWRGLAVKGYDVVAYFTIGQPTKGKKTFSYRWQDANWRFSNADNLAAFKAAPDKYAPQYGGY